MSGDLTGLCLYILLSWGCPGIQTQTVQEKGGQYLIIFAFSSSISWWQLGNRYCPARPSGHHGDTENIFRLEIQLD